MSVLIEGMKIPKNCKECPLGRMDDIDFDYVLYCTANKKYADLDMYDHPMGWNCPITEVPTPHGELVDRGGLMDTYADRLTAVAERYSPDSSECGILSGAMKLLAIMPTIIEAED